MDPVEKQINPSEDSNHCILSQATFKRHLFSQFQGSPQLWPLPQDLFSPVQTGNILGVRQDPLALLFLHKEQGMLTVPCVNSAASLNQI